jgi:hypothetical protein
VLIFDRRMANDPANASQDRARIVFDCRKANDLGTINRESAE